MTHLLWHANQSRRIESVPFCFFDVGHRYIAFHQDCSIWTINADGTDAAPVNFSLSTGMTDFVWSPDGREFLLKYAEEKRFVEYYLARGSASGGKVTVLTGDLNSTSQKYPVACFPPAP